VRTGQQGGEDLWKAASSGGTRAKKLIEKLSEGREQPSAEKKLNASSFQRILQLKRTADVHVGKPKNKKRRPKNAFSLSWGPKVTTGSDGANVIKNWGPLICANPLPRMSGFHQRRHNEKEGRHDSIGRSASSDMSVCKNAWTAAQAVGSARKVGGMDADFSLRKKGRSERTPAALSQSGTGVQGTNMKKKGSQPASDNRVSRPSRVK